MLETRRLAPLDDRYAVLAYGSNACPDQLLCKYHDLKLNDVPVLHGRLVGAEAVYAKRKTKKGYVPATLARKVGDGPSWITLLTAAQLKAMDTSEGRPNSYVLAVVHGLQFTIGRSRDQITPIYSYVEVQAGVMLKDGRPVTLRAVRQKTCQSILASATSGSAANWLTFEEIPNPNPPAEHSRIIEP